MKRSQMISLMAKVMEENFDGDNGFWESDAEKVLDAIEAKGMLPPQALVTFGCGTSSIQTMAHEWEDEDA